MCVLIFCFDPGRGFGNLVGVPGVSLCLHHLGRLLCEVKMYRHGSLQTGFVFTEDIGDLPRISVRHKLAAQLTVLPKNTLVVHR